MHASADLVTASFPRAAVEGVVSLSKSLSDRMHFLLERNNNEALPEVEKEELERLVEMAQFAQILAMSLQVKS